MSDNDVWRRVDAEDEELEDLQDYGDDFGGPATTYAQAKGWGKASYQIDRESLALEYSSVNKNFLLNRGWTRTAIKRILGEPDRKLPMRKFRHDRPECRYDMARVLAAEARGKIRYRRPRTERKVTWDEFVRAGCVPPTGIKGIPPREER